MNQVETRKRIEELQRQIAALPPGSITKKTINGKEYFYHRWTENKNRHEKYIPIGKLESFQNQIEQRKALERELKKLNEHNPIGRRPKTSGFATNIIMGRTLHSFAEPVMHYSKRECFQKLHDYIHGTVNDKVLILFGLRRTGKTTMIRQILADMNDEELSKAAFIQITANDSLANLNKDLWTLEKQGFRYIFIDEVTLMSDFIEGAALFSDVFASCGMKIVLSGTDSLGFLFAEDEQLYDRCIMIHTTFIPYREFESVLGIHGIDEYIRYGGTMSIGGVHYNKDSTFANLKSTDEYIDTAIAHNIQHSLRYYQYGGHFRRLHDLYEKNELTSAINRVVEDINHRFTLEVLTRDFKSHDLGISANNLRHDRENPSDILDHVDVAVVTETLRKMLEIRNKDEQTVVLDDAHVAEIKDYLELLDLTCEVEVLHLPDVNTKSSRTIITQPGLRYAQANALINSLLLDETFKALSIEERTAVQERIQTEIKGRMLEDITILETKLANPDKQVFSLQFPIGEFDMVVFDPQRGNCMIFEIKHSEEVVPQQFRHLIDDSKCTQTQHRFGTITGKFVLYRGETLETEGIQYKNVEEYLREI